MISSSGTPQVQIDDSRVNTHGHMAMATMYARIRAYKNGCP
jgi:hypothetical protein